MSAMRMNRGTALCSVVLVGLVLVASAAFAVGTEKSPQDPGVKAAGGPGVITGKAVRHDVSQPMRDLAIPAAPGTGPNREVPILQRPGAMKSDPGQAPDGALQGDARPDPGAALTPPVDVSFSALSDADNLTVNGFQIVPPDTNGDIGFDGSGNRVYFQYINSIWAVYDATTGAVITGPNAGNTFWSGFGGNCEANNDGDPVVLYDDDAGRWVVTQFAISSGTQCVAVSTTSDPIGAYNRYAFVVTPGGLNDYPKMGVWAQAAGSGSNQSAYTFTTRDFGGSSGFGGSGVMERDAMLAGGVAQFIKFENPCVGGDCIEGQLPAHQAGDPPPFGTCPTFFSMVDAAYDDTPFVDDGVRNHTLCVDWSNLGNSTYTEGGFAAGVNIDRFLGGGFSDCISPVMGGEVLDCLAAFTMFRAQYRWHGTHASVVMNTTVDAGSESAGAHWNEMRSTDGDSAWSIFQEGTFAPADGIERWMGSIAMDGDGNIALGYSAAGGSLFPSVRYTTRTASSPAGVMDGGEESCHEGTGAQISSSNRWGDYSSMSVDPSDDCTFWYTQEYYETTGSFDFNTRVCSFKLADCGMGGGNLCGNGVLDMGEECDDANMDDGDGCSSACVVEDGWDCTDPIPPSDSQNMVADFGFEDGTPSSFWAEASTNFGTPLCTLASCGTGTGTGPFAGDWWAWFGGIAASEVGSVEQSVIIPSTATDLVFQLEQIICDSADDFMEARIDGTPVFTTDGTSPLCGTLGYAEQTADVSAFADDASHDLSFFSEVFATNGGSSNFFVDNVVISDNLGSDGEPSVCTLSGFGGESSGLTVSSILCQNLSTGQKIAAASSDTVWQCADLGLQWSPGDRVETGAMGVISGSQPMRLRTFGTLSNRRATCSNRTTQQRVSLRNAPNPIDCGDIGLVVSVGDRAHVVGRGEAE